MGEKHKHSKGPWGYKKQSNTKNIEQSQPHFQQIYIDVTITEPAVKTKNRMMQSTKFGSESNFLFTIFNYT